MAPEAAWQPELLPIRERESELEQVISASLEPSSIYRLTPHSADWLNSKLTGPARVSLVLVQQHWRYNRWMDGWICLRRPLIEASPFEFRPTLTELPIRQQLFVVVVVASA